MSSLVGGPSMVGGLGPGLPGTPNPDLYLPHSQVHN